MKSAGFCYIDHSKPLSHPYYDDHMNAHIRTKYCERAEERARKRRERRKQQSRKKP